MNPVVAYYESVSSLLKKIVDNEQERIQKAATILAEAIQKDRLIYVLGTGGHSSMAAEEMFWRAGGLVPIYPILDPGLSVMHGALRSNLIERTPGYIAPILKYHGLTRGDVLILCNAYGINAATIDAALECRTSRRSRRSPSPPLNSAEESHRAILRATPPIRISTRWLTITSIAGCPLGTRSFPSRGFHRKCVPRRPW